MDSTLNINNNNPNANQKKSAGKNHHWTVQQKITMDAYCDSIDEQKRNTGRSVPAKQIKEEWNNVVFNNNCVEGVTGDSFLNYRKKYHKQGKSAASEQAKKSPMKQIKAQSSGYSQSSSLSSSILGKRPHQRIAASLDNEGESSTIDQLVDIVKSEKDNISSRRNYKAMKQGIRLHKSDAYDKDLKLLGGMVEAAPLLDAIDFALQYKNIDLAEQEEKGIDCHSAKIGISYLLSSSCKDWHIPSTEQGFPLVGSLLQACLKQVTDPQVMKDIPLEFGSINVMKNLLGHLGDLNDANVATLVLLFKTNQERRIKSMLLHANDLLRAKLTKQFVKLEDDTERQRQTKFKERVHKALTIAFKLTNQACDFIVESPHKMLSNDFLKLLAKEQAHQYRIAQIISLVDLDPNMADTFADMQQFLGTEHTWLWLKVGTSIFTKENDLQGIFDGMREILSLDDSDVEDLFKTHPTNKVENAIDIIDKHRQTRSTRDKEEMELIRTKCRERANLYGVKEEYVKMCLLSKKQAEKRGPDACYNDDPNECLQAARIVAKKNSRKRDVMLHMQHAAGKSFVCHLVALYYQDLKTTQKIAIVTTTRTLKKQLAKVGRGFDLNHCQYYTERELHKIDPSAVLIFDEYYDAMRRAKLWYRSDDHYGGILGLEHFGKHRILLSGNTDPQLENELLPHLFHKGIDVIKAEPLNELINKKVSNRPHVTCIEDEAELDKEFIAQLIATAKRQPVIVFGGLKFENTLRTNTVAVYKVTTDAEVDHIKGVSRGLKACAALYSDDMMVGIDVVFGRSAKVFLFQGNRKPNYYEVQQKRGRASRDIYLTEARIFFQEDEKMRATLTREMDTPDDRPWKDGLEVIRLINKRAESDDDEPESGEEEEKQNAGKKGEDWIMDREEYDQIQEKKKQNQ